MNLMEMNCFAEWAVVIGSVVVEWAVVIGSVVVEWAVVVESVVVVGSVVVAEWAESVVVAKMPEGWSCLHWVCRYYW